MTRELVSFVYGAAAGAALALLCVSGGLYGPWPDEELERVAEVRNQTNAALRAMYGVSGGSWERELRR